MKKTLLVLSMMMSASSFAAGMDADWAAGAGGPTGADTDSASAKIDWVADLPTTISGKWVTLKGQDGYDIAPGVIEFAADGTFATTTPVKLELRYWDPATGKVGDIVSVGDKYADASATPDKVALNTVTYTALPITFTSALGADVSGLAADITANGVTVVPNAATDASAISITSEHKSEWAISSRSTSVFTDAMAGDTITASGQVTVDLDFVDI